MILLDTDLLTVLQFAQSPKAQQLRLRCEVAADRFKAFRKQKVQLGTLDLKIASIALAFDVLLLSANLVDFRKVPALRVEDWTA